MIYKEQILQSKQSLSWVTDRLLGPCPRVWKMLPARLRLMDYASFKLLKHDKSAALVTFCFLTPCSNFLT